MADPLHMLLDVQAHDLAGDVLRHRRASLPERAELTAAEASIVRIGGQLADLDTRLAELGRRQRLLEDEVATLTAKSDAENVRLYSGKVTSPRELQSIQEEIDSIGRRRSSLEDNVLVLMEETEPLQTETEALTAQRAGNESDATRLRAAIVEAERVIDAELAVELAAREELVAIIPADLVTTYEQARKRLGGVAIARLEGAQCGGCHLTLTAMELDSLKKVGDDTVVIHEECGRILVAR